MSAVTIEDTEYDLFCQQRLQNPYPLYARLREVDPVHWCEPLKSWLVTRHKDVFHGLRDTRRLSTSREGMCAAPLLPQKRELARPLIEHINHWLLNNDPPDHTRMRKLINLAFTPRMLRRMLPRMERLVDQLLDQTSQQGDCDFIEAFCLPLPAIVICDMLGESLSQAVHRGAFSDEGVKAEVCTDLNGLSPDHDAKFGTALVTVGIDNRTNPIQCVNLVQGPHASCD